MCSSGTATVCPWQRDPTPPPRRSIPRLTFETLGASLNLPNPLQKRLVSSDLHQPGLRTPQGTSVPRNLARLLLPRKVDRLMTKMKSELIPDRRAWLGVFVVLVASANRRRSKGLQGTCPLLRTARYHKHLLCSAGILCVRHRLSTRDFQRTKLHYNECARGGALLDRPSYHLCLQALWRERGTCRTLWSLGREETTSNNPWCGCN